MPHIGEATRAEQVAAASESVKRGALLRSGSCHPGGLSTGLWPGSSLSGRSGRKASCCAHEFWLEARPLPHFSRGIHPTQGIHIGSGLAKHSE